MNDGYEYMIQREDGRLVFGGARWKEEKMEEGEFDDSHVSSQISKSLQKMILEYFPIEKKDLKIEQEWTGIMGYTKDGYPLVGPLDATHTRFIVAGFKGHGMSRCFGRGKAIAEMISGKLQSSDFIRQFSPARFAGAPKDASKSFEDEESSEESEHLEDEESSEDLEEN